MKRKPTLKEQALCEQAWLNLDINIDDSKLYNPLAEIPSEFENEPELYIAWLMSRPEYFYFICNELLNLSILPTQALFLSEIWKRKFPMFIASRGFGKSFLLGLYCLLRLFFMPGRKIAIVGAGFRQAKFVFEYVETIWNGAPLFRDLCGNSGRNGPKREQDLYRFTINDSYLVALPIGDGTKIRGQRAHDIICDEFASITKEIAETVVFGFAAVAANPIEKVQEEASKRMAEILGVELEKTEDKIENQIVVSGTSSYIFNHFYEYWQKYHDYICSKGDYSKLGKYFKDESELRDFDHSHYSIIRMPYDLIPRGFMDAGIVARARAVIHSGTYAREYGAAFPKDSAGFFKMAVIKECEAGPDSNIHHPSCGRVQFKAKLEGSKERRYVIGIDPASERDNFAVVVIELHNDHRRIVYVWTTNKKQHNDRLKEGVTTDRDFYSFCHAKIRDLMRKFPCERLVIDSQGGGITLREALGSDRNLLPGEKPVYPIIDYNKPKDTDVYEGLHILELFNFAAYEQTAEANHGMKFDFENKLLLFPYFDAIELGLAEFEDFKNERNIDTLEQCVYEIEELKGELANIVLTPSNSGRERWDTPDKVEGTNVKVKTKLRKDRYSALVIANAIARKLSYVPLKIEPIASGGFSAAINDKEIEKRAGGKAFAGPDWLTSKLQDLYR